MVHPAPEQPHFLQLSSHAQHTPASGHLHLPPLCLGLAQMAVWLTASLPVLSLLPPHDSLYFCALLATVSVPEWLSLGPLDCQLWQQGPPLVLSPVHSQHRELGSAYGR